VRGGKGELGRWDVWQRDCARGMVGVEWVGPCAFLGFVYSDMAFVEES